MSPTNGEYTLRPYHVLLCDRFDEDDQFSVTIPAALGPHDARNQARELHPRASILKAELIEPPMPAIGTCPACGYESAFHLLGACPSEAEARGRSGSQ